MNTKKSLDWQYNNQGCNPKITVLPYIWNPISKLSFDDSPTDYVALARILNKQNEIIGDLNSLSESIASYICTVLNWAVQNDLIKLMANYNAEEEKLSLIIGSNSEVVCNEQSSK